MKTFTLALLLIFAVSSAQSSDSAGAGGYLCIPDFAIGYSTGKSKKWQPTTFEVEGKKYLLRSKKERWYWTEFGEEPDEKIDLCSPFNEYGFTDCSNRGDQVRFNQKTLRFQVVRPYGYVVADTSLDTDHPSTPLYEIGTCSPF